MLFRIACLGNGVKACTVTAFKMNWCLLWGKQVKFGWSCQKESCNMIWSEVSLPIYWKCHTKLSFSHYQVHPVESISTLHTWFVKYFGLTSYSTLGLSTLQCTPNSFFIKILVSFWKGIWCRVLSPDVELLVRLSTLHTRCLEYWLIL